MLEAKLQLKEGNPEVIRETMKDLTIRRTTKQPLEYPSVEVPLRDRRDILQVS